MFGEGKLSKSKESGAKECIDPRVLAPRYSTDAVRYFLYRESPFGCDGGYSTEAFLTRINADLANNFGNLVSRTFSMNKKYFNSQIPQYLEPENQDDIDFRNNVVNNVNDVKKYMQVYDITKAVTSVLNIFTEANTYIQKVQPWVIAKEGGQDRLKVVIRSLLEAIRIGSELFYAFAPNSSSKVLEALGLNPTAEFENLDNFKGLKDDAQISELEILFPRLDVEKELKELSEIANY